MHMHSTGRRAAALVTAAAAAFALSAAAIPAEASGHGQAHRHTLPGSTPHWLHKAKVDGNVADSTQLHFSVLLKMRDRAGADALIQQLSTPGSPDYGRWLTDSQFRQRFAPQAKEVAAVQRWLRSQGLHVDKTFRSGLLIEAHGSTAQVEKTFATKMRNYTFQGHEVHANASPLSLPAGTSSLVEGAISGVVGLDQGSTLKKPADPTPPPAPGARYGVHQPCSTYFGEKTATSKPKAGGKHQPWAVCGYTPQQLQKAYGVNKMLRHGVNGRGITVAITDAYASPTIEQDVAKYNRVHHQPQFKHGQFLQVTPPPDGYDQVSECGGNGWYGEETLDVEAVHAMAPGARVIYVGAKDCSSGLDDAWASTIDNHLADVITNSWSDGIDDLADLGQSYIDFYQDFSTEAALTGITVNFSSGDSGDHTAGGTDPAAKTAEFPADLPYVTGVGGTSLEIGRNGKWKKEYGWQTAYAPLSANGKQWGAFSYSSGGGGGASMLFDQPFYQRGVVPPSMSTGASGKPMRVVPDIAMDADPNTGMVVGQTQVFPDGTYWDQYRIGGTSLASPLLAGVAAVAGDYAGRPIGFANPLYYRMASTGGIHDLIAPTKPVYQVRWDYTNFLNASQGFTYKLQRIDVQTSTLHDDSGYDDETGVGSPDGPGFFTAIARQLPGHGHGHQPPRTH